MRREGSAFNGLGVVMLKELADHLTSIRFIILELIVMVIAVGTVYVATQQIKDTVAEDPFLFLKFFTTSREPLPSFIFWLSLLVPVMAIGLSFDAVNSEHNRRTLSRILSQPIYRDALLFGKFLGALMTLAIALVVLWLLVIGLGLLFIGIPPGGEEVARAFVFLLVTIVYAGVWLALALLFSILFRSAATAALATLGLWLFFYVIWPVLAGELAQIIVPPDPRYMALGLQTPGTVVLEQFLARLSPSTLVRRNRGGAARSDHPRARADLFEPVAGRRSRRAAAAWRKRLDRLAADRRLDRHDDYPVRHRLRGLSAPGSARLAVGAAQRRPLCPVSSHARNAPHSVRCSLRWRSRRSGIRIDERDS